MLRKRLPYLGPITSLVPILFYAYFIWYQNLS